MGTKKLEVEGLGKFAVEATDVSEPRVGRVWTPKSVEFQIGSVVFAEWHTYLTEADERATISIGKVEAGRLTIVLPFLGAALGKTFSYKQQSVRWSYRKRPTFADLAEKLAEIVRLDAAEKARIDEAKAVSESEGAPICV